MKLQDLTKDERSLLLFFEAAAVDFGGKLNQVHMNADDFKIAEKWMQDGFVEFGRIRYSDITNEKTYYAFLSDEAFTLAHQERKARYERMKSSRKWQTIKEKMDATP